MGTLTFFLRISNMSSEDDCCVCIPIKTGCHLICVLGILGGVMNIIGALTSDPSQWTNAIIAFIFYPIGWAGVFQHKRRCLMICFYGIVMQAMYSVISMILMMVFRENACDNEWDDYDGGKSEEDFKDNCKQMKMFLGIGALVGGIILAYFASVIRRFARVVEPRVESKWF